MQRTINKAINKMKRIFLLLPLFILLMLTTYACDECSIGQPRILRAISHGTGPDSKWDLLIVSLAAASVMFTLFYSVKWLIVPGEKSKDHIKNFILKSE